MSTRSSLCLVGSIHVWQEQMDGHHYINFREGRGGRAHRIPGFLARIVAALLR